MLLNSSWRMVVNQAGGVDQRDISWMNVAQGSESGHRVDQLNFVAMGAFDIATRGVKAAINSPAFALGE